MTIPKVLRNVIAAVFMLFLVFAIIVQARFGKYPSEFKTDIVSITIIVSIVVVCLWLYLYIRKILKKQNLSIEKIRIYDVIYLVCNILITRFIFAMLFLNTKLELLDLSLLHSDLIDIVPSYQFLYQFLEKVNNIIGNASVTVYIFNTLLFIVLVFTMKKIFEVIISSELVTNISVLLFTIYPKYLYYGMTINLEFVNLVLVMISVLLLLMIIK